MTTPALRAARSPARAAAVLAALGKGWWYKLWYPLRGVRFRAGRNLRVEGSLRIRGPGTVIFGDDVVIGMRVTPWTHHRDAVIRIGSRCYLNGARFGCRREIAIGDDGIIAEAHLLDTDFHSTRADRRNPEAPVRTAPVTIGPNVWIAAQAGILPGTSIGANSVVGFGAVCSGEYPPDVLILGNPARPVRPIERPAGVHPRNPAPMES